MFPSQLLDALGDGNVEYHYNRKEQSLQFLVTIACQIDESVVLSMQKSRTIESASGFLIPFSTDPSCEGFDDPLKIIFESSLEDDTLLRFYKLNTTHAATSDKFEDLFVSSWSNPVQSRSCSRPSPTAS